MSLTENKRYILLTILALLSAWLAKNTETLLISKNPNPAHSPDYFSNGYSKWQMNEQGTLKSTLNADKIIHFSDDQTTRSTKPVMIFYNAKNPPWFIYAESGVLSADGKDLLLEGQVTIERSKTNKQSSLTIHTSMLKVQPDKNYAETKEWAEFVNPPNKTTGTGMNMTYIEPIHIEFLANVKGNYEHK